MRVAILTTDNREHHRRYDLPEPYFGPAIEAVLQGLAKRPSLEIHVVSCTQKPMAAPPKIAENIWFHLLEVPKIGWLRTGYQGCIRAVRKRLRQLKPDVVHGQGTERDCAISAVFSGFPNVVTIHGNMRSIARISEAKPLSYDWCAARVEGFTLPRTSGVFCNSAFTEAEVKPLNGRTWRVPNALRLAFFAPLPETRRAAGPRLLNIGTIAKHKRQIELLQIAERLHEEGHPLNLQFIGPLPPTAYAAQFQERIALATQEGFASYSDVHSLPELLSALDEASALVHVPSAESFGLVVGEALARNLKFFGTTTGGVPDVAGGVEGVELFALEDNDGLREAVARWLRAGCPRPGSAAAEMKKRFHPDLIAEKHEQIYREVTGSGK